MQGCPIENMPPSLRLHRATRTPWAASVLQRVSAAGLAPPATARAGDPEPSELHALGMTDCEAGQHWQGSGRHGGRRLLMRGTKTFRCHPQNHPPSPLPHAPLQHAVSSRNTAPPWRRTSTKHNHQTGSINRQTSFPFMIEPLPPAPYTPPITDWAC